MATQPDSQQTISGPSASPLPVVAALTPQNARHRVVMQWEKESKIKTCKCKICDERVKKFCHRCKSCGRRICSECSEEDGQSLSIYKEIALDYLQDGCWCGFRSNFNSAFRDRIPQALAARPVVAPASTESRKRKRKQSVKTDVEIEHPTAAGPEPLDPLQHPDGTDFEEVPSVTAESSTRPHLVTRPPDRDAEKPAVQYNKVEGSLNSITLDGPAAKGSKVASIVNLREDEASQAKAEDGESGPNAASPQALERSSLPEAIAKESKRIRRRAPRNPEGRDHESNAGNVPTSSAPRATSSRKKQGKEPEPHEIVIIGAGVIGMFIAVELGKRAYASGKKQQITVVDINAAPFSLASGQSAGFLTIRDMPDSWLPLVNAAAPKLGDLIDSEGFCHAVNLSRDVFTIAETGKKRLRRTTWLNDTTNEDVVHDEDSLGLADSVKLGHWLHDQCEGYGVEFRFNSHPTKMEKDRAGNITGVGIQKVDARDGKAEILKCSHLVLAVGPFTKTLFGQLFPSSPLHLENHVHSTQWMELSHTSFGMERKVGLMMPYVTADKDMLEGRLGIVVDPSRSVIKASCSRRSARAPELKQRDALEGREHSTVALSELAAKYLHSQKVAIDEDGNITAHGSAYVSTGRSRDPVVSRVRPTLLDSVSGFVGGAAIWLCYGFGDFGTTVAAGVGCTLAEMILGGAPTVDLSDFAVQE